MSNNDIAIRVETLSKMFTLQHAVKDEHGNNTHELWALKDVSFEIKKGESVGIIGPNGSGKSTLLKILAGVTKPTTGKVEIFGRVASILDIGAGFHPELSGRENVFLNGQLLGFSKKEIQSKFDEIVDFSGIEKFIDEQVKNYSNGMYLRLAFSIMAHLDFDVYLFDEVFSVGDAEFSMKTKKKFNELTDHSKTVLFVSHNLNDIGNNESYMLIEYGLLKQKTTHKDILSNYIESKVLSGLGNIINYSHNANNFNFLRHSNEVELINFSLLQEGSSISKPFRNDLPFELIVDYKKTSNIGTLDVVVCVMDYNNNVIMILSPFIKGTFSNKTSSGNYNIKCTLPAYVFGSQIYKVSLYFLKNCVSLLNNNAEVGYEYLKSDKEIEMIYRIEDVIVFKTIFFKEGKELNLSSINLNGGLLLGYDWK